MSHQKNDPRNAQGDSKASSATPDESSRGSNGNDKKFTDTAALQMKRKQDRLEMIEQADERTSEAGSESATERARDVGADTAGDPGKQLSQPSGDGNYVTERGNDAAVPGGTDTAIDGE